MSRYVVGRIAQIIPTLLLTSIGVFILLRMVPGDATTALAGPDATPETIIAIRHDLGLDQPIPIQYLTWLRHIGSGDLGLSFAARRPVTDLLGQALPASLELLAAAMLVAVTVGIGLGVLNAEHVRSFEVESSTYAARLTAFLDRAE